MSRKNLPSLPLLCTYYDLCDVNMTYFADVSEYQLWERSASQYGVVWSYLIDKETGKIMEANYA